MAGASGPQPLSQDFIDEYQEMCAQFDRLAKDLFTGEQLELLTRRFLNRHQSYMAQIAGPERQLDAAKAAHELIDEDLQLVSGPCHQDPLAANPHASSPASQLAGLLDGRNFTKILADVHRRACQACYLRVTFNKSRRRQEDDRREPVEHGRRALRLDPDSFLVVYWYMIALGWQLDVMASARDKTLAARLFKQAALRCTRLNPSDPLAHHLLGRYYYNVASLTWVERALAKNLLGCKLEGSYQDAEREFAHAHQLKADWLPTGLWLARVMLAQHRPMAEISKWVEFGLAHECREPSTEIERNELLELRSRLKIAKQND